MNDADYKLLELAAKAAGELYTERAPEGGLYLANGDSWNPLEEDGEALRLAVKVLNWPHMGRAFDDAVTAMYAVGQLPRDPCAATRRAIVLAASKIGRAT